MTSISERERGESSWANWADFFHKAGYAPLMPDWPGDPETVEEPRANPRTNALDDEKEAKELYDTYHVACSGIALVHMGNANLNRGPSKAGHEEPGPRSPADHRRREGPHGPVGDRERRLQAAKAQRRRDRDREGP